MKKQYYNAETLRRDLPHWLGRRHEGRFARHVIRSFIAEIRELEQ